MGLNIMMQDGKTDRREARLVWEAEACMWSGRVNREKNTNNYATDYQWTQASSHLADMIGHMRLHRRLVHPHLRC